MTWFKIDDSWHSHPKVLAAGNAAAGLWVRIGSYCSQYATEGFARTDVVKAFGSKREIETLIGVGLLARVDSGYQIPDFLEYNPTAETVKAQRKKAAERQRRWREKQAADEAARNGVRNGVTSHVSNGVMGTSTADGGGSEIQNSEQNSVENSVEFAFDHPEQSKAKTAPQQGNHQTSNGVTNAAPSRPVPSKTLAPPGPPPGFDEFWAAYPRHKDRAKAEAAFKRAVKKTDLSTMLAALAAQKLEQADPHFVPYPTSWLNGERWNDEITSAARANRNNEQSIERPDGIQMSGFYR